MYLRVPHFDRVQEARTLYDLRNSQIKVLYARRVSLYLDSQAIAREVPVHGLISVIYCRFCRVHWSIEAPELSLSVRLVRFHHVCLTRTGSLAISDVRFEAQTMHSYRHVAAMLDQVMDYKDDLTKLTIVTRGVYSPIRGRG